MQALQATTSWAAACLGLERDLGTLEKGKRADVVVVDGDPLADVRILPDARRIKLVMKDGVTEVRR
jgi:imidazolonepropionase-like amidohydrolase